MTALASRIAALANRWPKSLALLLGALSAAGFAPLNLWPLTVAALAGWMALVARSATWKRALGIGWAFGVGHFVVGLNWIATAFTYQAAMPAWLGWVAVVLLSLYLALYPAIAAWGAWILTVAPAKTGAESGRHSTDDSTPKSPPAFAGTTVPFLIAFAALWTLTEWLRSWVFTGFAWNPLSAIFTPIMPVLSPARVIGTYGMSAVVILFAGFLLSEAIARVPAWRKALGPSLKDGTFPTVIIGGVLIAVAIAGAALVQIGTIGDLAAPAKAGTARTAQITVVQPNVGQQDKWEGDKAEANFAKLARLTVPQDARPRLILWPEAAIPDYLETGYPSVYYDLSPAQARARIADLMNPGDVMLLGALKLEMDKTGEVAGARNAVMTVYPDGTLGPRYDKAHLVPYGEYLPMRPLLSAIGLSRLAPGDIDFWPGPGSRTLALPEVAEPPLPPDASEAHRMLRSHVSMGRPALNVGLQICYEIIFSGQVVDRANRPDFLFNPSNDAWFGSWGPPQHLAQARLRAIEEGLPVVRSTPTGISAVIDANGRILDALPMHRAGRIDTALPPPHAATIFARFGNILPVGFAVLLLGLAIAFRRRGR